MKKIVLIIIGVVIVIVGIRMSCLRDQYVQSGEDNNYLLKGAGIGATVGTIEAGPVGTVVGGLIGGLWGGIYDLMIDTPDEILEQARYSRFLCCTVIGIGVLIMLFGMVRCMKTCRKSVKEDVPNSNP